MTYIRQHQLPNLKTYRYAGVDHSLISRYVLKPFYNRCVINCFPMGMAPNAITLTGFLFVVINFITILWYNPALDHDCPPWVYASCAIGLFLYQTFDAVDGMQARRTRQSSPLGELFDHSVDACNTALGVIIFAGVTNLGQTWATILSLFGATMTFYVQTWDEYYTQVLTLGIISGPVEGVLTLCTVFAFTAYQGGGSFWHRPMLETIGIPKLDVIPAYLYEMPFTQWYLIYGAIILFFATGSSIVHVMKVQAERGKDTLKPLQGLIPLVTMWTLVPVYLYLQPTILEHYTIPFMLLVGLINAYAVGNMIVAHLIKADFPFSRIFIGIVPLALGVLDGAAPLLGLWQSVLGSESGQVAYLFGCLGLAIGVYGSFVHDVITTICDYIDIWCLSIKHPHVEERPVANGQPKKVLHSKSYNWLPFGRGWDEHTARVKITSKRKRIPFKLRHLHETTSFASTPLKQAISVSAAFQSISLIDFLSRQDDYELAARRVLVVAGPVLAVDLLNPTPQAEARKHKLKTLVPAPRSFFMDVKCPGCFTITTVFSHAQTVVVCAGCSTVLCQPTGGKARLTEGCSFRRK
ncbi:hypothetical protein KXW35_005746 [Aspergillus fumigatus]|nr:hypothetical protein KXX18_004672 [Aspergillus fumigatus]KAH1714077.1 hypothetical protein KXX40_004609 [Aspergillus fumigatus]KAH1780236.1 hypothetical protein KXX07_009003 [Aspergillus fumigatus]KAH1846160.1 hypothetical protein KXX55_001903 [Aspergillus fumigatus]KAH2401618.1 hypothetical protein KXV53_003215 [Aspergillus fumigatus]